MTFPVIAYLHLKEFNEIGICIETFLINHLYLIPLYFSMIVLWYISLYTRNCGDGENFKLRWCVFLLKKKTLSVFRVEFKFNILKPSRCLVPQDYSKVHLQVWDAYFAFNILYVLYNLFYSHCIFISQEKYIEIKWKKKW